MQDNGHQPKTVAVICAKQIQVTARHIIKTSSPRFTLDSHVEYNKASSIQGAQGVCTAGLAGSAAATGAQLPHPAGTQQAPDFKDAPPKQ